MRHIDLMRLHSVWIVGRQEKANEIIASMLLTWHNLTFYQDLTARLRAAIACASLTAFADRFLACYLSEEDGK